MKCPECGYELKPEDLKESNVCPECGTQLPDDFISLVVSGDEDNNEVKMEELDERALLEEIDEDNTDKKGKFSFKIILIIIVVLVVIAGASFFFFIKPMLLKREVANVPDTNLVEEFPFDTSSEDLDDTTATSELSFDTSNVDTSFLSKEDNVNSINTDSIKDTLALKKDSLANKIDTNIVREDTLSVKKDTVKLSTMTKRDSLKVKKEEEKAVSSAIINQDTIKKASVKKISKKKIYSKKIRKRVTTKDKKQILPKKKIDYTKIYPYKGSIKFQNGKLIKDRFKTGKRKFHYITFTSDKIQKLSFDDIFKIKFFYEGPIYLSDSSYISKVTASVFLNDGSKIENIIIDRLSLMTMKSGSFLIVNNYKRNKRTKNINSIDEIIFKKE